MACLERFIKFLNRNAFVQIALQGKSFCSAAKDAIVLLIKNPGRFAVVNGLGSVFILLGKLFICALSTFVGYILITEIPKYKDKIYSPILPVIVKIILI